MAMHATDVGLRPLVKAMANRANAMGRRTLLRLDELAMQQVDGEFSTLHNISLNPSLAALHVHAPPTQTNDALHKSRHWIVSCSLLPCLGLQRECELTAGFAWCAHADQAQSNCRLNLDPD